jgi:hypothetical protein
LAAREIAACSPPQAAVLARALPLRRACARARAASAIDCAYFESDEDFKKRLIFVENQGCLRAFVAYGGSKPPIED